MRRGGVRGEIYEEAKRKHYYGVLLLVKNANSPIRGLLPPLRSPSSPTPG